MIRVDRIAKSFGARAVLRDISFDVAAGEVACLIGPSGSGKSTILRCLNGLESHDSGDVFIEGERLTASTMARARRSVSMVFQRFNLFPHRTVIENVIAGPVHVLKEAPREARERAMALLDKVGMAAFAESYPDRLSGGQQQRVGIARALAMQPRAILFDEPTSALDPERVGEVLKVMRDLADEGLTMIIVSHEIPFAREVADTAIFMDEGLIVEKGPAREVLTRPQAPRTQLFLSRVLNPL